MAFLGIKYRGIIGSGAALGFGGISIPGQSNTPLLLDLYPDASAAYSVRKLRTAYAGAALRVRRSSDNSEQDIGFVGEDLDTASLLSFVGAGDGFVVTWYDQSGNGNNATKALAEEQPQIVSSGSVITENSKPTISFLSGLSGLDFSTFSANSVTMFMIVKAKNDPPIQSNSGFVKFGTDPSPNHFPWQSGDIYDGAFSSTRRNVGNPTTALNQLNLYNVLSTSTEWTARLNESQIYTTLTNTVAINANPKIGSKDVRFGMDNFITELIIYPSNQSSNRSGIETDINAYYSIY
jgi:hypothetical protein